MDETAIILRKHSKVGMTPEVESKRVCQGGGGNVRGRRGLERLL